MDMYASFVYKHYVNLAPHMYSTTHCLFGFEHIYGYMVACVCMNLKSKCPITIYGLSVNDICLYGMFVAIELLGQRPPCSIMARRKFSQSSTCP